MSRSSTLGGLLLFVAIGVVLSLYGPAIPELRQTFEVGASASGLVLSAHFAGAMVGIAGWALLDRRLGTGASLRLATALLVAGAAGLALAPAWPVVLVAAAVVGVGFGVLVVALNTLFAAGFGNRGAAMLNLLGACFGAGAILGPLAFAATGGFRGPFLGGAVLAVASLPLMRDVRWTPLSELPTGSGRPAPALIGGFVLLYVLYVGVESGVGGWEATSLMAEGAGEAVAANWTAGYWAAITAGRLLAIPFGAAGDPTPAGRRLAAAGRGLADAGPHPAAGTLGLHADGAGAGAGLPHWARLAGRGSPVHACVDGAGDRRRATRRGGASGGDWPADRCQLPCRHPVDPPRRRARLPGHGVAAAPLRRPPVTTPALGGGLSAIVASREGRLPRAMAVAFLILLAVGPRSGSPLHPPRREP